MRIVMMGTGPFAVPTFRYLLGSEQEVVALITRPVPAQRRRAKAAANPMREVAEEVGLVFHDPQDINEPASRALLREMNADLLVVCDYGQILSAETLALGRLGGINLHGSLLPKYRGAAPVNWAILNGDAETGVTVIHMTPGLDAGPCLAKVATPISDDDDAVSLEKRLSEIGVGGVMQSIAALSAWDGESTIGEVQDKALATKAPRLKKEDGLIDWTLSARELFNRVRGLKPWPATFVHWTNPKGQSIRIIIDQVRVVAGESAADVSPGHVALVDKNRLHIATSAGHLEIVQLQPAGKKMMEAAQFLRGYAIQVGDPFGG